MNEVSYILRPYTFISWATSHLPLIQSRAFE